MTMAAPVRKVKKKWNAFLGRWFEIIKNGVAQNGGCIFRGFHKRCVKKGFATYGTQCANYVQLYLYLKAGMVG